MRQKHDTRDGQASPLRALIPLPIRPPAEWPGWAAILALVTLAFAPKLLMILLTEAHTGGDSQIYTTVAANIWQHFCVSLSAPESGACVPHWGGNQLPGYPAFMALVWLLFGRSTEAVLIVQSLVFALAAARLAWALMALGLRGWWPWLTVLLLGASPSLIGWSRSVLTETLSAAAALWLLAELILSWHQSRLRILPTALAFTAGVFLRYDFVLLALPTAVAGFMIHRPVAALGRGLGIALIAALAIGAWGLRSIGHGLPATPPFGLTLQGEPLPRGMMAWLGTWLDDQYQLGATVWRLVHRDYDGFQPPPGAWSDRAERQRIDLLLSRLRAEHQGQAPPPAIDQAFAAEASRRSAAQPWRRWLLLPLRRNAKMWLSPYPSMGWPAEIADAERGAIIDGLRRRDWPLLIDAVGRNAGAVGAKVMVALDRYALVLGMLVLVLAAWRRRQGQVVFAAAMILALLVARSLLSGYTLLVETRYLVPTLAWLGVASLLAVASTGQPAKPPRGDVGP